MAGQNSGVCFRRRPVAAFAFLVATSFGLGACADLAWPPAGIVSAGPASATQAAETDYGRGKRELMAGRFGLAVRYFLAALDQAPDSVEALNGLGAAFDRLGRFDLSARAYGRALAIDPDAVQTLNNMGYSFFLQGRYDLAVAYLRDASSRAGADALTIVNHRLAEMALARAGGPPPRSPGLTSMAAPAPAEASYKPHIRRAGKAIRELVTKSPETAGPDPAPNRAIAGNDAATTRDTTEFSHRSQRVTQGAAGSSGDLLPAFVAAPMAIDGAWAGVPALGAVGRRSAFKRAGGS